MRWVDPWRPHELQHSRLPCSWLSPWVCSNSHPLSQRCHPTICSVFRVRQKGSYERRQSQKAPGVGKWNERTADERMVCLDTSLFFRRDPQIGPYAVSGWEKAQGQDLRKGEGFNQCSVTRHSVLLGQWRQGVGLIVYEAKADLAVGKHGSFNESRLCRVIGEGWFFARSCFPEYKEWENSCNLCLPGAQGSVQIQHHRLLSLNDFEQYSGFIFSLKRLQWIFHW